MAAGVCSNFLHLCMIDLMSLPLCVPISPASSSEAGGHSPTLHGSDTNTLEVTPSSVGPSPEEIEKQPWRWLGYRGYARFLSSDDDFLVFRRFDYLNSRVLLALQDQITVLEEELDGVDEWHSRMSADTNNGCLRDDMADRQALVEDLSKKLYRYSKHIETPLSTRTVTLTNCSFPVNRQGPSTTGRIEEAVSKTTSRCGTSRKLALQRQFQRDTGERAEIPRTPGRSCQCR
jgi:hypothetical protein